MSVRDFAVAVIFSTAIIVFVAVMINALVNLSTLRAQNREMERDLFTWCMQKADTLQDIRKCTNAYRNI